MLTFTNGVVPQLGRPPRPVISAFIPIYVSYVRPQHVFLLLCELAVRSVDGLNDCSVLS